MALVGVCLSACSEFVPPERGLLVSDKTTMGVLDSDLLASDATLRSVFAGSTTVGKSSSYSEAAARVQQALYDLGRLADVDGVFGSYTEGAIMDLQSELGLAESGIVDRDTLVGLDDQHGYFASRRFWRSNIFLAVREGEDTLEQGSSDEEAVTTLQATLYSLGYDIGSYWIDADFGGSTASALTQFQSDEGLSATGILDAATLDRLDDDARIDLDDFRGSAGAWGGKAPYYRVLADIASRDETEALGVDEPMVLWVLETATDEIVAGYLTSPGREGHETAGDFFHVRQTLPREWWTPTESMEGSTTQPPGVDNPMGILKLNFLEYYQAIHGTPSSEWDDLGGPASSGCLRLSGLNILDIHERFIEAGTEVEVNRDAGVSRDLWREADARGISIAPIDQGGEMMGAYVGAELGRNETWSDSQGYVSLLDPDEF